MCVALEQAVRTLLQLPQRDNLHLFEQLSVTFSFMVCTTKSCDANMTRCFLHTEPCLSDLLSGGMFTFVILWC